MTASAFMGRDKSHDCTLLSWGFPKTSPLWALRTEHGLILEDYSLARIRKGGARILVMRKSSLNKLDVLNSSTDVCVALSNLI